MFPRASRTLHICLRCKSRTISLNSFSSYVRYQQWQNHGGLTYRLNSSAAVQREERDGDNDNAESHLQGEDGEPATSRTLESTVQQDGTIRPDQSLADVEAAASANYQDGSEGSRPTLSARFRHWRPPTTAAMDRNFLGQPGEILVLPDSRRQKRHRQAETPEAEDEKSGDHSTVKKDSKRKSVYETLTSENTPMSKEEIMKSIDELRTALPPVKSQVSQEASARQLLEKSFSKSQLAVYIQNSSPKFTKSLTKKTRADLAAYVVRNIWALDGKESDWDIPVHKTLKQLILLVKHYYPSKLDFRTVTESHDGFRGTNPTARSKLERIVKEKFVTKEFLRPKIIADQKTSSLDNFVQLLVIRKIEALARENMVVLQSIMYRGQPKYKAYAFSEPFLWNFGRELSLLSRYAEHLARSVRPVDTDLKGTILPVVDRGNLLDGGRCLRLIPFVNGEGLDCDQMIESLQVKLQDNLSAHESYVVDYLGSSLDHSLRNQISSRFSVEFGKVNFNHLDINKSDGMVQEVFSTDVPYLPQFLAQQSSSESEVNTAQVGTRPKLSRLLFKPGGQMALPSLEIYADLTNSDSILIHEINLLFTQVTETISLPGSATDIRLIRHDHFLLFNRDKPVEERLGSLIASVAEQLPFAHQPANMYKPGNLNINYNMHLDTSSLIFLDKSDDKKHFVHYALEKAQTVQQTAYADSRSAVLERLSYTPAFKSLLSNSLQRQESLRLVQTRGASIELPSQPSSELGARQTDDIKENLNSFLGDAYRMAAKISDFASSETQRLNTRYPRIE